MPRSQGAPFRGGERYENTIRALGLLAHAQAEPVRTTDANSWGQSPSPQ